MTGGTSWQKFGSSGMALTALGGSLFWALYSSGAVSPSSRAISLFVVAVTAGAFQLFGSKAKILRYRLHWPVLFLLGIPCVQLVPLPFSLMQMISPRRAASLQTIATITGDSRWAPVSVNPAMTSLELTTALGCVIVFFLVRELAGTFKSYRWMVMAPVFSGGLAEAILGLTQAGNPSGPATATGTFLNRNHFAGFLEMIVPFAFLGGWAIVCNTHLTKITRSLGGVLAWVCGLLFLDAIFYTYSRMGLLVVLFILLLAVSLTLWPYVRVSPRRLAAMALLFVFVSVVTLFLLPKRLLDRFENTSKEDRISTDFRLGFWKDSLPIIKDYSMVGCGLGGFESVYPLYQRTGTGYRVEYAHNDYLQAIIELGIPAFLVGLIVIGTILIRINRVIWFGAEPHRFIAIACFSSISGMLLHSFVDFNLQIPADAMTFAWVLGLALSIVK